MPQPRTTRALLASRAGLTPTTVKQVATYRRASTDEENQPFSLDAQQTKLTSYIASQDDMEHVRDYEEYASAKDIEGRPELLRLLEDAAAGKFDTVLVHKVDRWSRRLADLLATVDFLDRHGVAFVSATEPIDTTTPLGRMVLQMLGSFAEFERSLIVERVTQGIETKVARNGLPLAAVGFGLRKNAHGVVEKDPATFGVVERIFREYTRDRRGMKAIATRLQEDGLPTPGVRPWSTDAVARVLRNRTLIGQVPFRGGWVDGAHEPLLDLKVFAAAEDLAATRSTPSGARRAAGDYVLSGTVYCGHCGGAYNGTSGTSKNKTKVRYYTCVTARRYGKATCAGPSVPADDLERLVGDALVATYADTDLFTEAVGQHLAERAQSTGPLEAELAAARSAVAAKERLLAKYRDDYETDALPANLYADRTRELRNELEAANRTVAELGTRLEAAKTAPPPTEADRQALHALLAERIHTGPVPVRKTLFTALVARLEVHAVDDVRPTFRLGRPPAVDSILSEETPADQAGVASGRQLFANHRSGWS